MNKHDSLCTWTYDVFFSNGTTQTVSCQCELINRVRESMKPECTCGHDDLEYVFHLVPCKQGAFLMSQDKMGWMDLDEI